jgi:transcriptional regulator with XRE-family HTH domain
MDREASEELLEVGRKMRELRQAGGLTLDDLATAAGVSRSLVSQVERGLATPSLMTLRRIAGVLGVPIAAMFGGVDAGVAADSDRLGQRLVVRRDQRKALHLPDSGMVYELLTADLNRRMELLWGNIPPGATSPDEPSIHEGEEFVLVIEGELVIIHEDHEFELQPGDSIYFDCTRPHRLVNRTQRHTQIVIAITPPSF